MKLAIQALVVALTFAVLLWWFGLDWDPYVVR